MKFNELKHNQIYESESGYYAFITMRNEDIATFKELEPDDLDDGYKGEAFEDIDTNKIVYMTKNDIQYLK